MQKTKALPLVKFHDPVGLSSRQVTVTSVVLSLIQKAQIFVSINLIFGTEWNEKSLAKSY